MTTSGDLARAKYEAYARHAATFDRQRDKRLFERAWLDRFLDFVPADGHVLDLGCGSGEPIAAYLLGQGRRVTGIDAAPAMIALARARFPEADWRVADMRKLSVGSVFDGVLAWNSLFHLTQGEQRAALPVLARHLKPGAPLMFTAGPTAGEATGTIAGQKVFHASLSLNEYRRILQTSACDVVDFVVEDPACNGHTILLAQRRRKSSPEEG